MRTFTDTVLAVADNISGKLGPVTVLFEGIIERITPQITARACGGYFCYDECDVSCAPHGTEYYRRFYSYYQQGCEHGDYNCYTSVCEC